MAPIQLGKWVVLFCDEINLPDLDKYGKCCLGETTFCCMYVYGYDKVSWPIILCVCMPTACTCTSSILNSSIAKLAILHSMLK